MQWILSASFWSHRWSNWANIDAVVYLAAKRTISVAISARIRTKVTWPLAGSIALLSSSFEVHKNEFHFLSTRAAAFLEKQTLELQQRGCNMMDIRGSHMLLSRNFTSAQNCGELIHYLVVLCFTLHDLTRLLCVKRWLYRNQSKNCQKIRQFEGISKICRNQSKIIRILKTVIKYVKLKGSLNYFCNVNKLSRFFRLSWK